MNNISDDSINEIRDGDFLLDSVPNDEDDSILTEYELIHTTVIIQLKH